MQTVLQQSQSFMLVKDTPKDCRGFSCAWSKGDNWLQKPQKDKEALKEVQECSGNQNIFLEKLDLASVCTFADKILRLPLQITAHVFFISYIYLIGFPSQQNRHSRNMFSVHGFLKPAAHLRNQLSKLPCQAS